MTVRSATEMDVPLVSPDRMTNEKQNKNKKIGKTNETEQMFSDRCGLEDTEIVFQRFLKSLTSPITHHRHLPSCSCAIATNPCSHQVS